VFKILNKNHELIVVMANVGASNDVIKAIDPVVMSKL